MAGDAGAGRAKGKGRDGRGFRRAGALIEPQTRAASARRGFAEARLKALWRDIVGEDIAALARPVKLALARGPAGGVLTLAVAGAHGPQAQMLAPTIRERVNAALGPGAVGRIQFRQAAGFAEPEPTFRRRPAETPPSADLTSVAAPLSRIGDADLRAALETLARNVLSRSAQLTSKED
ncbi:DUF721 domain-containing protein [Amaricoccus sp.]|uniref:DUF721 domain-containing protein n=1 Tax=Amaricoccus sp. TaxID=1872485 RepID=UPI001B665221|nr:DUF721 domain-containing protein [Amaricoccus sp.]MBP7240496.1 DUF721 domain-containing protein [Amaricoccus sp.]